MIGGIRRHLENTPFAPFHLRTADGREYLVPTIDHVYLPPNSGRVVVTDDAGNVIVLSALLISGILHAPVTSEPTPSV